MVSTWNYNLTHNLIVTWELEKLIIIGYICHFQGSAVKIPGQWTRWLNYIQQNFSWKSLLAMPVNLTSFCISSTYDTLPSPSNLKRWKLTTEASCFLCNKDTCTTSHILGACKVALSQGRFTFRHDNVLRIIISNIRSSIKTIKSSVPSSK